MSTQEKHLRTAVEKRETVLRYLSNTATRKPELVKSLSTSRSTIDRAVSDLIEANCIVERAGVYSTTATGELALTEYEHYVAGTDAIEKSSELLNDLPKDVEVDLALLRDASISVADSHAPDRAAAASAELLEDATMMKGLAPTVLKSDIYTVEEHLDDEFSAEIVAEAEVIDVLSDFPGTPAESLLSHESLSLLQSESELPYALWIIKSPHEEWAGITVHNSTGSVSGVIMNNSDIAVQWAQKKYEEFYDEARPISSSVES